MIFLWIINCLTVFLLTKLADYTKTKELSLRLQDTKKKNLKTVIFVSWCLRGKNESFCDRL